MNKQETVKWIRNLPLQTLTDELKNDIADQVDDIQTSPEEAKQILKDHGYIVETMWSWGDAEGINENRKMNIPYMGDPEFKKLAMRMIGTFDAERGIDYDHIEFKLEEAVKVHEQKKNELAGISN